MSVILLILVNNSEIWLIADAEELETMGTSSGDKFIIILPGRDVL
jgi:hypothetical protein